ncbi:ROK family protein, partial [Streptomyces sp. SID2955]|nr:ROK family protein [Streptomyces sp. SID2955]
WLGHGVGAAVVLDGTLRRGASGGTGEIGFLPVPGTRALPSATDCDGGFHSLTGAAAVTALAAECGRPVSGPADGPGAALAVRAAVAEVAGESMAVRAPAAGESLPAEASPARRFLHTLADRVAVGAASVVAVLDPGCVVLGGEVGHAGGAVLAGLVEDRLRRMSPLPTEVRASGLGGGAVLRGALLTARDRAQDELFAPHGR